MNATNTVTVTASGERELVIARSFNAPRSLVWDAHTKPELIRRWLLGPEGWTMPVCDVDLRVGGSYRYLWRNTKGHEMGMGGVYREIKAPERIVQTEKFDESWYPGEAVGTLVLTERGGVTHLKQTMLYESRDARDAVLRSPMESGLSVGYDRLDALLASMAR